MTLSLMMLGSSQLKTPQQYARMRRLYHHSLVLDAGQETKGVNIVSSSVSLDWEVHIDETHKIGGGERCLPVGYSFDAFTRVERCMVMMLQRFKSKRPSKLLEMPLHATYSSIESQ